MYYLSDSASGVNDTTCRVGRKVADRVTADARLPHALRIVGGSQHV